MPGEVVGAVAPGEDAGEDRRVQRLDPAVHHLGKPGHVGDVQDRNAGGGNGAGGAAGRDELDAQPGEPRAKRRQAGFIRNTQNRTHILDFLDRPERGPLL